MRCPKRVKNEQCLVQSAEGTVITDRPPPRSGGRDSRTRLQPWVCDGETLVRIRMKDLRFGNPVGAQPVHPLPREAILLATPAQRAQPNTLNVIVECFQRSSVGRHCVVGEEASD